MPLPRPLAAASGALSVLTSCCKRARRLRDPSPSPVPTPMFPTLFPDAHLSPVAHLTPRIVRASCYAMLCYAMLPCYAMLCYAMLCYAMLCCAMLCCSYVVLWCASDKHRDNITTILGRHLNKIGTNWNNIAATSEQKRHNKGILGQHRSNIAAP